MITTAENLATFLRSALITRETCRIYQDILDACWFPKSETEREKQKEKIAAFAAQHGWQVNVHTPAKYGIVAEFSEQRPK